MIAPLILHNARSSQLNITSNIKFEWICLLGKKNEEVKFSQLMTLLEKQENLIMLRSCSYNYHIEDIEIVLLIDNFVTLTIFFL